MASNVFGTAVTGENRIDMAVKAQQDPNADNKRDNAIAYVKQQKENSGNGVSTMCIFYNATGATLRFKDGNSKDGHIWDAQSYPTEVHNGQWGAFLHVKDAKVPLIMPTGTMAYAIYFVKDIKNDFCNCLIGWETPWNFHATDDNGTRAFCDIYEDGKIDDQKQIYKNIQTSENRKCTVLKKGIWIETSVESDTSPLFEAYFKLEAALD